MCTLTIIPRPAGFRVAINRDESHQRPQALPPSLVRVGDADILMPIDPRSRGTWIAATSRGYALALLNYNPGTNDAPPIRPGSASRGLIIPSVAGEPDARSAALVALALDTGATPPFRLVIVDRHAVHEVVSPGYAAPLTTRVTPLDRPLLFASSGLGDDRVDPPRRALFMETFNSDASLWRDVQDRFHSHRWPDHRHLSVLMHRDEARTVSRTILEAGHDMMTIDYSPVLNDTFANPTASSLRVATFVRSEL